MFTKTITNSGKFLKMPVSSRLLYYDLGMNADDDGYAERFTVMRMTWSSEQDLQVLKANWLVHIFDDNVLVILDRKENNYIQKDRYTPSKYLNVYKMDTLCIQDGYTGKDSIGKVRIEKDNISAKADTTLSVAVEEYTPSEITKRINNLIATIKSACVANGIVYGNSTQERNYAKHILSKKFNEDCLEQVGMDMDQFIQSIVKASVMLLYSKPLNSAKSIYYWRSDVVNKSKKHTQDQKEKKWGVWFIPSA